jgi:predicted esterase
MSINVGLDNWNIFAGIICFSGYVLEKNKINLTENKNFNTPLLIYHGEKGNYILKLR